MFIIDSEQEYINKIVLIYAIIRVQK